MLRAPATLLLITAAAGCQAPEVEITRQATPHTIALRWSSTTASQATVRYGYDDDVERIAAEDVASTDHRVELIGLPPLTEVWYEIHEADSAGVALTHQGSLTTDNLSSGLAAVEVVVYEEGQTSAAEPYLLGTVMGDGAAIFLMDRQGRWLWHMQPDGETRSSSHVLLRGDEILFNDFDEKRLSEIGMIYRASLSGEVLESIPTEGAHHAFAVLPDDSIAYIAVDARSWLDPELGEEIMVAGDRVMLRAPDGTEAELFNIWDHEEPTKSEKWDSDFYPDYKDWTHANALSYSQERGSLLLSLGNLNRIYEISASAGDVLQVIDQSWYTPPDSIQFAYQHDPYWLRNGHLLMMAHLGPDSIAIEYALDEIDHSLTEVWSYAEGGSDISFLGQAHRLSSKGTFINYGGSGQIREVLGDEVVWQLETSAGAFFGNGEMIGDVFSAGALTGGL